MGLLAGEGHRKHNRDSTAPGSGHDASHESCICGPIPIVFVTKMSGVLGTEEPASRTLYYPSPLPRCTGMTKDPTGYRGEVPWLRSPFPSSLTPRDRWELSTKAGTRYSNEGIWTSGSLGRGTARAG